MKFISLGFCIEAILLKVLEDFFNLFVVSSCIGGINENVVEIDDHTDIQHI